MKWLRALLLPALLLVAWELLTRYQLVNVRLLVPPSKVVATFLRELNEGALLSQLGASLARDLGGVPKQSNEKPVGVLSRLAFRRA